MGAFRLILAYLVVLSHTHFPYSLPIGGIAVAAFFFISGYLMPLAFDSNYKFVTFDERVYHYGVNRFLRIYPLYWISLVFTTILGLRAVMKDPLLPDAHYYFHLMTYAQNTILFGLNQNHLWGESFHFNIPAWSLDIELQYYILVPFLCIGWAKRRRLTGVVIIILSMLSAVLLYHPAAIADINLSFLGWALLFLLGFLYYYTPPIQRYIVEKNGYYSGMIILLSILFAISSSVIKTLTMTSILVLVAARLLVYQKEKRFGRMDSFCGDLSYPVYIMHGPILVMTQYFYIKHMNPIASMTIDIKLLLFNIIVTTIVAYILLRIIADPIENIRNRLKFKRLLL